MRGALAITAIGAALCAHGAKGQTNPYFPVTRGSYWHFDGTITETGPGAGEPVKVRISSEILSATRGRSHTAVVARMFSGEMTTGTDTYEVTSTEVRRVSTGAGGREKMKPPLPLLKLPARPGSGWSWRGTKSDAAGVARPALARVSVGAEKTVKVPAGSFRALPVKVQIEAVAGQTRIRLPATIWFARGVGMVLIEGFAPTGQGRGMSAHMALAAYRIH